MSLSPGMTLHCELTQETLTVRKLLGEGGQGAVFLVDGKHGQKAVKWYHPEQATQEQRKAITLLANRTPPRNFVWPLDLVTQTGDQGKGVPSFGYVMDLIDRSRFAEGNEVRAGLKPEPSFRVLSDICRKAAESYRDLHREGLCYRDISFGNLQFDPKTGDVLICDNDNVGVNNQSVSQIAGTWEFMAPELVMRTRNPSSETDRHSLAVLYFYLWIWHHPLHGKLEYNVRSWDDAAKTEIYGKNPIFIFDQSNTTNSLPPDPDYITPANRWKLCPEPLKKLFTKAFTEGLHHPDRRVSLGEWVRLFTQLHDSFLNCPTCRAENYWQPGRADAQCWGCKGKLPSLPGLRLATASGHIEIPLDMGTKLLRRHIDPTSTGSAAGQLIGEVVQNPADPRVWGIRNKTKSSWSAKFPDGSVKEVAPDRAAPLVSGIDLEIDGVHGVLLT